MESNRKLPFYSLNLFMLVVIIIFPVSYVYAQCTSVDNGEGWECTPGNWTISAPYTSPSCWSIVNSGPNTYFIPILSTGEWNAFFNNHPSDITVSACGGGCTPATCVSLGKNCGGPYSDGCGGQTAVCGGACGGGCTPATCASLGKNCGGPYSDGCGGTITCPGCGGNQVCSGSGQCFTNCTLPDGRVMSGLGSTVAVYSRSNIPWASVCGNGVQYPGCNAPGCTTCAASSYSIYCYNGAMTPSPPNPDYASCTEQPAPYDAISCPSTAPEFITGDWNVVHNLNGTCSLYIIPCSGPGSGSAFWIPCPLHIAKSPAVATGACAWILSITSWPRSGYSNPFLKEVCAGETQNHICAAETSVLVESWSMWHPKN